MISGKLMGPFEPQYLHLSDEAIASFVTRLLVKIMWSVVLESIYAIVWLKYSRDADSQHWKVIKVILWYMASYLFIFVFTKYTKHCSVFLQYFHFLTACIPNYKNMLYVCCRTYRLEQNTLPSCHYCCRNIIYSISSEVMIH